MRATAARVEQLGADLERERELAGDAAENLEAILRADAESPLPDNESLRRESAEANARARMAEEELAVAERRLDARNRAVAEASARRRELEEREQEFSAAIAELDDETAGIAARIAAGG